MTYANKQKCIFLSVRIVYCSACYQFPRIWSAAKIVSCASQTQVVPWKSILIFAAQNDSG